VGAVIGEGSPRSGEVGDHRKKTDIVTHLVRNDITKWECLRVFDTFLRDIDND
jgi:hypothetical protein